MSGIVVFSLNLSTNPTFHLEKAVASIPFAEPPEAVAPILTIEAKSGVIEVFKLMFLIKLEVFFSKL